jgi:hypothetical protein
MHSLLGSHTLVMASSQVVEVWFLSPRHSGVLKLMASVCQVDNVQVESPLFTVTSTAKAEFGLVQGICPLFLTPDSTTRVTYFLETLGLSVVECKEHHCENGALCPGLGSSIICRVTKALVYL